MTFRRDKKDELYFDTKSFFKGLMARKGNDSFLLLPCGHDKFVKLMGENKKFCFIKVDGVDQSAIKVRLKFLRSLVRIPSITNVMAMLMQILKEYQIREFFPTIYIAYKNAQAKRAQRKSLCEYNTYKKTSNRNELVDKTEISSLTHGMSVKNSAKAYKGVI